MRLATVEPRLGIARPSPFDGTFPGEPFRATATLRDGSRRTVVQASGG